jgi:hypothetical protein
VTEQEQPAQPTLGAAVTALAASSADPVIDDELAAFDTDSQAIPVGDGHGRVEAVTGEDLGQRGNWVGVSVGVHSGGSFFRV